MVRAAEELAGVAAGLRHQPRALVCAAVHQHLDAAVALAHDDQRAVADVHRQVVAGLGDLAAVADVVPGVGEEVFLLQAEDLFADVQVAVHPVGLHQCSDALAHRLGRALVSVHLALLRFRVRLPPRRRPGPCRVRRPARRRAAGAAWPRRRCGRPAGVHGLHQPLEMPRAAFVRVAVALDQALAARDLHGQRAVGRGRGVDRLQPGFDARVLHAIAQAAAAPAAQPGQRVQQQEAAQRAGLHDAALRGETFDEAPRRAGVQQPAAQAGRQRVADLLQPRVHELVDLQQLRVAHLDLAAHAFEAGRARLQVGHAHRVLVAHPQRQVARHLGRQQLVAVGCDGVQAVQVQRGIGRVLVVDQAAQAFGQQRLLCRRELLLQALQQRVDRGVRMRRRHRPGRLGRCGRGRPGHGQRRAFGKGRQAGLRADAAAADGVFEGLAAEGQRAAAVQRAEQHRADDAAAALAGRRHVEAQEALRRRVAGGLDGGSVGAAVAHRRLLGNGVDAVRRGDQRGAVGVTRPRCSARPASISSEASSTSTSPGVGISASTGAAPSASAAARGNSSR